VEGCLSLTGDDADELLPQVTKILTDALLQFVTRRDLEQQLDEGLQVGQRQELPGEQTPPGVCWFDQLGSSFVAAMMNRPTIAVSTPRTRSPNPV
jgi:hypothetical protein